LGSRKLSSVTVEDLERFYHDVSAGKTAKDVVTGPRRRVIVKGGPGAARKVFRDLSAVFSFAENRRLIEKNLCTLANVRKTDNSNERFLSADEIERLGAALKSLSSEGANPKAVNIIYLWLFTGCRRNEISALKWSEVDLNLSQINLGDTKTGKSSRPLVPQAARILVSIQREGASEYVFPSERRNTYYQGTRKVLAEAIRRADIPGVTPHTLRHTIGAHAASAGTSMPMLGAMLGHKNARSTAIYAHVELNPVTRVMTDVVESFAHLVEDHTSPEAC
jgi:integrase